MNVSQEASVEINLTCVVDCPVKDASVLQIFLLVLGIFGLILNAMVIYSLWFSPTPPTRWTLTNLGIGTLLAFNFSFFSLLKDLGYFKLDYPIVCTNWGFFERVPLALLPPTMLVAFFESTQHGKVYQEPKLSMKVAGIIFGMALLISIPGFFINKIVLGSGEYENVTGCWKVFIGDWKPEDGNIFWYINGMHIQTIYETIFMAGVSLPPCFFMIYFLHYMKFTLPSLFLVKKTPPYVKGHVSKIRWSLAYVIFYHLCYFLPACIRFSLTIWANYDDAHYLKGHWRGDAEIMENTNIGKKCWAIMNFVLVVLHPIFLAQLGFVDVRQKARGCFSWLGGLMRGQRVDDMHNIQIDILHVV